MEIEPDGLDVFPVPPLPGAEFICEESGFEVLTSLDLDLFLVPFENCLDLLGFVHLHYLFAINLMDPLQ